MITVHHLENSRSQRVLWLLEELGLEYEVRRYERDPRTMQAPQSLRQVHPLGKSPVISDGDTVVAESGAIVEYLIEKKQGALLVPRDRAGLLDYRFWLHYAEGSLMPPLLMRLVFEKIRTSPMPFFARPIAKQIVAKTHKTFLGPQLRTHLEFVEKHLGRQEWFAGDQLSAADIQMSFPLEASMAGGVVDEGRHPNICAWVRRCHEREAFRAALKAGGPYDFA